ncbi:bifunctional N-acetylglucosamine-1-phosphate uridyltransferase/glucosamine-1-phosphate acetyltransferase [Candidatus Electronema sp. PJ]|uniref:bifunctional UDP-N-acetylglucosamine diphosphorylase/glucosamine-1-phosphate N-acetyltransferase GlmU n=1 Tax=Candidatus Electronema sp. PJ TaxID=3401572 RepID=UPI003AA7C4E6
MNKPAITAVILAAGKGTRMKSAQAKVLHELYCKPMLHHVLDAVAAAGITQPAVIVGHQREQVLASLQNYRVNPVVQEEQLGTGHAVLCAETACAAADLIMILCGDTPLIRPETLRAMIEQHQKTQAVLTLMTTELDNPFGYGRIISNDTGHVLRIVEQKDADEAQRAIREINAGIYVAQADFLFAALRQVGTNNSQGEVYLTDIVGIAVQQGVRVEKFVHHPAIDVLGVNSRVELAQAHAALQLRRNHELMLSGVTIYSPETVLVSPASTLEQDVILQAGVQIKGRCALATGVILESGVVLQDCTVGSKAVIGAHSVLRGCTVREGEHVPPLTKQWV